MTPRVCPACGYLLDCDAGACPACGAPLRAGWMERARDLAPLVLVAAVLLAMAAVVIKYLPLVFPAAG